MGWATLDVGGATLDVGGATLNVGWATSVVGKAAEGRCTLGSGPVVSEVLGESKTVQYMDMCVCTCV